MRATYTRLSADEAEASHFRLGLDRRSIRRAPHMSRWHAMESGPEETDRVAPAGPLRGSGNLTGPASSGPQDRGRVLRYRY
jgi:hypothetical protein